MDDSQVSNKCIICAEVLKVQSRKINVTNVTPDNFQTIKKFAFQWKECGETTYDKCMFLCEKYEKNSWKAIFHRKCYQKLTNSTNLQRQQQKAKSSAIDLSPEVSASNIPSSSDLPSSSKTPSSSISATTRAQTQAFKSTVKEVCVFCNEPEDNKNGKTLHSVSTRAYF